MNFSAKNIDPKMLLPDEFPILPSGEVGRHVWTEFNGEQVIRNVESATLIPIRPPEGVVDKGESVLIAPGGGMLVLAIENEGINVAKKLANLGYTAYVLKYRLNRTPSEPDGFADACASFYNEKMSNGFGKADADLNTKFAVDDFLAAVSWIRENNYSSGHKLHFVGFSAGAKVCADALKYISSPDSLSSIGLIYFSLSKIELHDSAVPPLFAVLANDDPLFSYSGFSLIEQWQLTGQDVEFHLFKNGGHGFGVRAQGKSSDQWFDLYVNWLRENS